MINKSQTGLTSRGWEGDCLLLSLDGVYRVFVFLML